MLYGSDSMGFVVCIISCKLALRNGDQLARAVPLAPDLSGKRSNPGFSFALALASNAAYFYSEVDRVDWWQAIPEHAGTHAFLHACSMLHHCNVIDS